jgi:flagellar hook-associated protein 3 FlgL
MGLGDGNDFNQSRALQISNTRMGDRYIFGGFQTMNPPFDMEGNYYGDDGVSEIEINSGQSIAMNMPGSEVFFGKKKLDPEASTIRQDPQKNNLPSISALESKEQREPSSVDLEKSADAKQNKGREEYLSKRIDANTPEANVMKILKDFKDALNNHNVEGVRKSLETIDTAFTQVVTARSLIGAQQRTLEMSQASLEHDFVTKVDQNSRIEAAAASNNTISPETGGRFAILSLASSEGAASMALAFSLLSSRRSNAPANANTDAITSGWSFK